MPEKKPSTLFPDSSLVICVFKIVIDLAVWLRGNKHVFLSMSFLSLVSFRLNISAWHCPNNILPISVSDRFIRTGVLRITFLEKVHFPVSCTRKRFTIFFKPFSVTRKPKWVFTEENDISRAHQPSQVVFLFDFPDSHNETWNHKLLLPLPGTISSWPSSFDGYLSMDRTEAWLYHVYGFCRLQWTSWPGNHGNNAVTPVNRLLAVEIKPLRAFQIWSMSSINATSCTANGQKGIIKRIITNSLMLKISLYALFRFRLDCSACLDAFHLTLMEN